MSVDTGALGAEASPQPPPPTHVDMQTTSRKLSREKAFTNIMVLALPRNFFHEILSTPYTPMIGLTPLCESFLCKVLTSYVQTPWKVLAILYYSQY